MRNETTVHSLGQVLEEYEKKSGLQNQKLTRMMDIFLIFFVILMVCTVLFHFP